MDEDESPKEPEEQMIQDKAGRSYRLTVVEVGNLWVLRLYDGGLRVGEAKCHQKIYELLLGDLCIFDQVTQHDEGIGRIFRPVFGPQQKACNYRGRGLPNGGCEQHFRETVLHLAQ